VQLVQVLLVPKLLGPGAFLQYSLVLPLAYLGASLGFGWITSASFRYVHELLEGNNTRFRQTVFFYFGLMTLVMFAAYPIAATLNLGIYALIPVLLIASALKAGILSVLNAAERHRQYLYSNIGFAVSLAMFLALCVLEGRTNLADWTVLAKFLLFYSLFDTAVALFSWFKTGIFALSLSPQFDSQVARRCLKYGLPILLNSVAVWVISLSDRYFLALWQPADSVASYILSYQLAGGIIAVPMGLAMIVLFPRLLSIDRNDGERAAMELTQKMLRFYLRYSLIITTIAAAIIIALKYFVYIRYQFDPMVIIILALANVVGGLCHFYNKEFELNGRTFSITKSIGAGAVVNAVLNLALIPFLGPMGAAIATLAAYMVTVVVIYQMSSYRPSWAK